MKHVAAAVRAVAPRPPLAIGSDHGRGEHFNPRRLAALYRRRTLSSDPITVGTNGHLTASIIDAAGAVLGGFEGPESMPLVMFTAQPGQTTRIPLLVGTASYRPKPGYTIPPDTWRLTAPLHRADRGITVTPPLTFIVTD